MKFNDVTFPHPVLGVGDAIMSKSGLNPAPNIISSDEVYSVTVTCDHDNEVLAALVDDGQAEFICEATCSSTLYREVFRGSFKEFNFQISKKQVRGAVYFTCLLVAKNPINEYQNIKTHPDYNGFSFDIDAGDVLAFFGEFNFNADINYQKLKAISSFMEVKENKDDKAIFTNIDLNKSKIEVQLPSEDYILFANDSISKEQNFAPIFHASIVLNALLIALYNFDSHHGMVWARVIEYRLKTEEQFENLSLEEKENIPEIAQRLLGNPFRRLINELQAIIETPNPNEEN